MEDNVLDKPEYGQEEEIRYAGFFERVFATCIDFMVLIPVWVLMYYNIFNLKSLGLGLLAAALPITYKTLMEGFRGATIGKKSMSIVIVNTQQERIKIKDALIRNGIYLFGMVINLISTYTLYKRGAIDAVQDFSDYNAANATSEFSAVSFLVGIAILISVLFVTFDKFRQSLHDKIARTYCIIK